MGLAAQGLLQQSNGELFFDATRQDLGTLSFRTNSGSGATPRLTITNTGDVGIGTTSPWGLLSINPNNIIGPSFVVGSSSATSLIVTNGGNVGVKTASPNVQLETNGIVRSTRVNSAGQFIQLDGRRFDQYVSHCVVVSWCGKEFHYTKHCR